MNRQSSIRQGFRATLAVGILALAVIPLTARAQASSDRYQPERTREDYSPPAASEDGFDYAAQTLRVSVWLDRDEDEVYRRGDEQRVVFETNEDAYAVVYRIDTDGLVTVLWPRDRMDDGFVFGGHEYRLPGREAPALRIDEQEGEGYVQAIVSRYPFDLRALEVDFLAGDEREEFAFRVAGDPFLAMNEVNYAITGLEDSRDQVITNHARYYVHRVVDHPRYLCSQCHDSDDRRYDPYAGDCTLDIDYDYGWGNRWYATYGYYPVYWNPVYVYVDPWTWRPWVNFWYDPWYTCAPWQGWRSSYWGCYTWRDSPYYGGGCWSRWDGGDRRYRPLNRHDDTIAVRKLREYDKVSRQVVRGGPGDDERSAMVTRRPMADRGETGGISRDRTGSQRPVTVARGDRPAVREVQRFPSTAGQARGGALRIRPGRATESAVDGARDAAKPSRRHTAGGREQAPSLAPAPIRRGAEPASRPSSQMRENEREGVRTLTPRQQGTRVWNGGSRGSAAPERGVRPERRSSQQPSGRDGARDSEGAVRRDDGRRRGGDSPSTPRESARPGREPAPTRRELQRQESPRQESPRQENSRQETRRQEPRREAPPAAAPRQDSPRRAEPARGRDGGERGDGNSSDDSGKRGGDTPVRRSPTEGRR